MLIKSVSIEMPSVSDSRMNSWRRASHIWPVTGQEFDALRPLRFVELDFLEECVKVLHQALHDLLQARILGDVESAQDFRGDVVFGGETGPVWER